MNHFTNKKFWKYYFELPENIQKIADKKFELLKHNPKHPSIHFKKIENYRSVRITLDYRALGIEVDKGILWFWIGFHDDYDEILSRK